MGKVCGDCRHFQIDNVDETTGISMCEKCSDQVFADNPKADACRDFSERRYDISKAERAIKKAHEYREANKGYTSVGCFITTAVVEILGMKDDSPILESLRFMRGNHMQDNPEYRDLLMLYDVVGPVLAKAIKADENSRSVAEDIFTYLKKATKFIALDCFDEAIQLYRDMTEALMNKYDVKYCIGDEAQKNYDQKSGGHGAFTIKKKNQ